MAEVKLCLAQSSLVKTEKADSLLKLVCDLLLQTATRHRSASDVVFTHTFSIMVSAYLGHVWVMSGSEVIGV